MYHEKLVSKQQAKSLKWRGRFNIGPVLIIALVHALAVAALFFFTIPNAIGFLISHFLVGCLGAVIGLHRYFSHKSFKCPAYIENILGFLGALNLQNVPITWAMYHRAHHRHSDGNGDPHSASRGFFWSHIQWMFYICPNGFKKNSVSVRDLTHSKFLNFLERRYLTVNAVVGGLFLIFTRDIGLFLWVFPLRIVIVWHSTWLINSYVHSAPLRPSTNWQESIKNSAIASLLMYGDGWHRNHHEKPYLPRAGSSPWQPDIAYLVILGASHFGMVETKKNIVQFVDNETAPIQS